MASRIVVQRSLLTLLLVLLLSTIAHGQTLRFLAVGFPADLITYFTEELAPEFEARHGVKVNIEPVSSWNARADRILLSIAAGVPYDIVSTGAYSAYEEGSGGMLAPLNRYLEGWEHTSSIPAPIWDALSWRGNVYVMPHNTAPRAVAYNKSSFAESGLDAERPPASWDELIETVRTLTRVTSDQVTQRGWHIRRNAAQDLMWFTEQAGVSLLDLERLVSNLSSPQAHEALYALRDLMDAAAISIPAGGNNFAQGNLVMEWHNPPLMVAALEQNPELAGEYGLFAPRRSPEHDPVAFTFVDGLGILAESANKDLAWEFISFLNEDEVLLNTFRRGGYLPGRTDMVDDIVGIHATMSLFYDVFPYAKMPVLPLPRDVSQGELATLVSQVYAHEISPEEALIRAGEVWDRLLAEWRAELGEM